MKSSTLAWISFFTGLLGLSTLSSSAHAYPQMVRHGYQNCTSCHVSPSGGGVLNAYGRELSQAVLSTWGREGEGYFAYGFGQTPEWLQLGGEYRSVYVYRDTPAFRDGRHIVMQADLEGATRWQQFTLAGTLGYQEPPRGQPFSQGILSRRHYLSYAATENVNIRAGKFNYAYGINSSDHIGVMRRALEINDQGQETYNIEASYLGESNSAILTAILARPDVPEAQRERGASLVLGRAVGEASRAA